MNRIYIGIDNGVTGSIATYTDGISTICSTPVFKQKNYTKAKGDISRVNFEALHVILNHYSRKNVMCFIERPMINPGRFKGSISAARCLEATQIALELCNIPYQFIDSKEWQKEFFPKGKKEKTDLKKYSMEYGLRYFPQHSEIIKKRKEADALLIALWAHRNNL